MPRASQRQLRIFVSSTFNDMMEERNVLLEKVFPRVAAYCHVRKAEFIGVDLRWGVTEERSRKGETVVETNIKAFDAGFASANNKC